MRTILALLTIVPLACAAPSHPTSAPSSSTSSGDLSEARTWSDCYRGFVPNGIPRSDLKRLTYACGSLGGMRPLTPIALVYQRAQDPSHHYALDVPAGGGCYRVYAAGDRNVADLDLLISDTRGPITGDATRDAWPILPPQGPLCIDAAGRYLLEVAVTQGAGYYALQVWGSTPTE
jgi:hypothetical protein